MKVRVEVVCLNAAGDERRRQVLTIERRELMMETLGMNLTEGKALLAGVQDFVVTQQAREELEQRRACPHCRRRSGVFDPRTELRILVHWIEAFDPDDLRKSCTSRTPPKPK